MAEPTAALTASNLRRTWLVRPTAAYQCYIQPRLLLCFDAHKDTEPCVLFK